MDKLGKVLFNIVLYLFLFTTATLTACFIIWGGCELAHYIDKMF